MEQLIINLFCNYYACRILAQICYKILEQSKDAKQKHTRQTIFEVLMLLAYMRKMYHIFVVK